MAKYFDENGNQVEAFTQAELDAKLGEVTKAKEAEVAALNEKIKGYEAKDQSFATLKAELDKKDTEIKTMREDFETSKVASFNEKKSTILKNLTAGDPELLKKIETEMAIFNIPANDTAALETAAAKAYQIVTNQEAPKGFDAFGAAFGSRGNAKIEATGGMKVETLTPEQKSMQTKLGISTDDVTKYGDKVK